MKHTVLFGTVALACLAAFGEYSLMNLPKGDSKIVLGATDPVRKVKELDIWSTKANASVKVERVRTIDLYTNAYDTTSVFCTNGIATAATSIGYMNNFGCIFTNNTITTWPSVYDLTFGCVYHPWETVEDDCAVAIYNDNFMRTITGMYSAGGKIYAYAANGSWVKNGDRFDAFNTVFVGATSVAQGNGVTVVGKKDGVILSQDNITGNYVLIEQDAGDIMVAYGNGIYVAVPKSTSVIATDKYYTSANGTDWTSRTFSTEYRFVNGLKFLNGRFYLYFTEYMASGWTAPVSSVDGITWSEIDGVGGEAVICGKEGSTAIAYQVEEGDAVFALCVKTSTDGGETWVTRTNTIGSATMEFHGAGYAGDLLYVNIDWGICVISPTGEFHHNSIGEYGGSLTGFGGFGGKYYYWNSDGAGTAPVQENVVGLYTISGTNQIACAWLVADHTYTETRLHSEGVEDVRFPAHNMVLSRLNEKVITNRVYAIKAKTSTQTLTIAEAQCTDGFLSCPVTNDVYLVAGDTIKTTGIEDVTDNTKAIFIYEK